MIFTTTNSKNYLYNY